MLERVLRPASQMSFFMECLADRCKVPITPLNLKRKKRHLRSCRTCVRVQSTWPPHGNDIPGLLSPVADHPAYSLIASWQPLSSIVVAFPLLLVSLLFAKPHAFLGLLPRVHVAPPLMRLPPQPQKHCLLSFARPPPALPLLPWSSSSSRIPLAPQQQGPADPRMRRHRPGEVAGDCGILFDAGLQRQ